MRRLGILVVACALLLGAVHLQSAPGGPPLKIVFLEGFRSPDLAGWDREWLPGFTYQAIRFEDGSVFNGAITREVDIPEGREVHLEFTAEIVSSRGELAVALFHTWSGKWEGYLFHLDGESYIFQPNLRIYRMDHLEKTRLGYYPDLLIYSSHSYHFARGKAGNWRLWIDGFAVENVPFRPDDTYQGFTRVGFISNGPQARLSRLMVRVGG